MKIHAILRDGRAAIWFDGLPDFPAISAGIGPTLATARLNLIRARTDARFGSLDQVLAGDDLLPGYARTGPESE